MDTKMDDKVQVIFIRLEALEKDFEAIKTDIGIVKEETNQAHRSIMKMEMIDQNIFDKLESIADTMKTHRDNFNSHDENEMQKYKEIDKRLVKIEKLIWMALGGGILFQFLNQLHLFNIN